MARGAGTDRSNELLGPAATTPDPGNAGADESYASAEQHEPAWPRPTQEYCSGKSPKTQ
jgi:hypothetical protein